MNFQKIFRAWRTVSDLEEAIIDALNSTGRRKEAIKFEALLNDDVQFVLNYDAMKTRDTKKL